MNLAQADILCRCTAKRHQMALWQRLRVCYLLEPPSIDSLDCLGPPRSWEECLLRLLGVLPAGWGASPASTPFTGERWGCSGCTGTWWGWVSPGWGTPAWSTSGLGPLTLNLGGIRNLESLRSMWGSLTFCRDSCVSRACPFEVSGVTLSAEPLARPLGWAFRCFWLCPATAVMPGALGSLPK